MRSLYVEGGSVLHRLSARVKLIGLFLLSLLVFATHSPVFLGIVAVACAAVYLSLNIGWHQSWLRIRVFSLTIVVVALFTLALESPAAALETFFRLSAMMLAAAAVTATTTTGDFIDQITAAAWPLERIGLVKAADIGLGVGLVIRFVPEVVMRYQAIRDAHYARGLKMNVISTAVPLIILTLRNADEIAAAIDARSIRGQK
jgi:biotin transport system permease protein